MNDDPAIAAVAETLVRIRRRLLPPGSWRERWARRVYVPLLRRLGAERRRIARIEPMAHPLVLAGEPLAALPPGGRVLVLKLDHIGDLVVGLPALARLRAALPDARITLVCGGWNRELAEASGLADEIVVCDYLAARHNGTASGRKARERAFAATAGALGRFDLALDLRHDPDTRVLLGLVEARVRAGYACPGVALDLALPDVEHVAPEQGEKPLHARTRLVMLVAAVLDAVRPETRPGAVLLGAGTGLSESPAYAVIAPGAGAPIRVWDITRMAEVAAALATRHGLRIVLMGGPGDRALAATIAGGLAADRVLDLTGATPLGQVPAILAGARLVVGMDSGLSHLAASLGVATVSVQSGAPTRDVWRVAGERVIVVAGDARCSPCHFDLPAQCPHDVACLRAIGAGDVLAACERLLNEDRGVSG